MQEFKLDFSACFSVIYLVHIRIPDSLSVFQISQQIWMYSKAWVSSSVCDQTQNKHSGFIVAI